MRTSFFLLFIVLFPAVLFSQEKKREIILNAGAQNSWEKDLAYSPLLYKGVSFGSSLGYIKEGERKRNEIYFHYSSIPMQNAFDAGMIATQASVITYTFYQADRMPQKLTLGWSNNNALSLRNFQDAHNFNPRFDFHTSFGPAVRYQTLFGETKQWCFSSQAHWQIIGFLFSASYVTSPPDPFLHEQSTINAFWQSIRFFHPFQQQDFGIMNQLFYQLANGNAIGIGYRFNYTNVVNAHRSQKSQGQYFFQLNFRI